MKKIIYLFIALCLLSCEKNGLTNKSTQKQNSISGYLQKGPFIINSRVSIQELSDSLTPNGVIYETYTLSDFGYYNLETAVNTKFVEVITSGYYFNEITGELSNSMINLKAISSIEDSSKVNVNVLTTLSYPRIKSLIQNEGIEYNEAKSIAQEEVLGIFNIKDSLGINFEELDISKEGDENAKLIAISCILQSDNSEAELSELISKISFDLAEDGQVDDDIIKAIKIKASSLDLRDIRTNIKNRYNELGLVLEVSNFEQYALSLFTYSTDKVSTDLNTGLKWLKHDPNVELSWDEANNYCKAVNVDGLIEWRLPTIKELEEVSPYIKSLVPKTDITHYFNARIWSSDFAGIVNDQNTYNVFNMEKLISGNYFDVALLSVLCVHD